MVKEIVKDTPVAMWDKIKNIDLELFALKEQFVNKHAKPVIELSKDGELYLLITTQAALPQLEEKLRGVTSLSGKSMEVETRDKFIVIKTVGF